MTSHEIVTAVRDVYPKFSKAALSLGRRPLETGVCFTTKAAEIIDSLQGRQTPCERFSENRKKSIKFMCRLSPADAGRVKRTIKAHGFESVQEWLEALILNWEKESRSPACKTEGRQGEGNYDTAPASENITNDLGGQE